MLSLLKVYSSKSGGVASPAPISPNGCARCLSFQRCLTNPPASAWILSRTRRILDISIAISVLSISALPMLVIAVCVRLSSKGNAIFSQERIGLRGRPFRIYKFRSMASPCGQSTGLGLTKYGDMRVTSVGRVLRKLKLDELPQFYNILRGEMSLIGPRPKLHQYAAMFNMPYRPGISGAATVFFRNEEEILREVPELELESYYKEHIKPAKVRLDVCYMCRATASTDMRMLTETLLTCMNRDRSPNLCAAVEPVPSQS